MSFWVWARVASSRALSSPILERSWSAQIFRSLDLRWDFEAPSFLTSTPRRRRRTWWRTDGQDLFQAFGDIQNRPCLAEILAPPPIFPGTILHFRYLRFVTSPCEIDSKNAPRLPAGAPNKGDNGWVRSCHFLSW